METIALAREEKNLQDAREDYQRGKEIKKNQEMIEYLQSEMIKEKEAVRDCIDQEFFTMAAAKLERLQELKENIVELKAK